LAVDAKWWGISNKVFEDREMIPSWREEKRLSQIKKDTR
jgi:hypothetical protein